VVEAIARLRRGEVRREAGYDGVYGTIHLFDPDELASRGSGALFDLPKPLATPTPAAASSPLAPAEAFTPAVTPALAVSAAPAVTPALAVSAAPSIPGLDADQAAVVTAERGPLLVIAGPGAGKTRVLVEMIAHRIADLGVAPECCLAITFTRRAANELRERLAARVGEAASLVMVATFHSLGLAILREQLGADFQVTDDNLDELVTRPAAILAEDEGLAESYRQRWTDVFVDEYQDVDEAQYRLLRCLTAEDSPVTAIGDPDQAIYGFRGGDVGYFLRFRADYGSDTGSAYGGAREARLERSYRSAPTIVKAAMQLIRPGTLVPGRRLTAARTDIPDGPVLMRRLADERDEAEFIAATVEKMLGGTSLTAFDSGEVDSRSRSEHQLSFSDFAVLYRTSSQASAIAEALARRGFPAQQRSHTRLADMPGVASIMAALSGQFFVTDSVAAQLRAAAELAVSVSGPELADPIRVCAEALAPLATRCGDDLTRFLHELALGAEIDTWDPRADRITLLTLHASKGLEFPVVFIAGCDDGLLPLRPWKGADIDYAEERRLLFVGMTRATTRLVLTGADKRVLRGAASEAKPSPFLSSVDRSLLEGGGVSTETRRRRPAAQQLTLL
jgi:superfamily I DNA/RNA helicase